MVASTTSPVTTLGSSADRYIVLAPRALRGVLASLALVMLAASLDSTAVGTALPRIVTDLHGNELYAWVFTIYLLTMTATMPAWGSLSDRFGRRNVLFVGVTIFLVGSALCGLAQEMWQLIVFRGIQGLGAGAIVPISLATIGDLFPPADRARLQAAFSSLFVLAFLIGPTLGGILTDTVGWRWVFTINLPVGLVSLAVMSRFMPPLRGTTQRRAFDYLGVALFTAAVVPFLVGVRNLPDGDITDPAVGGLMLLGLAIGALFLVAETRAQEPIVPVRLFRDPTFAVASAVVFLSVAGLFVSIVYMPRYFQFVHGASATSSGWQIMTLLLGLIVGAVGCAQVVARTGHWKLLLLAAMVVGACGMLLLSGLRADSPLPLVWAAMFLTGLGLGPISAVLTAVVQTTVPAAAMGVATSTLTFSRQLGASIWLAISGSIFSTAFSEQLPARMTANAVPADMAQGLTSGSGAVASEASTNVGDLGAAILAAVPGDARAAVEPFIGGIVAALHEAFSLASGTAFWIGIAAVGAAFLLLLPLRETRLPLERLAEIRGRAQAPPTAAPSTAPSSPGIAAHP
jgi:EmrB/QacA subfamily drug resistance transporter